MTRWRGLFPRHGTSPTPVAVAPATAVALTELAPYQARNGDMVTAGCFGVSHGSGLVGELIRHATRSWAGHAFIYIGNGLIIEGVPEVARVATADSHPDALWNTREPLTTDQRLTIVSKAHALVGTPYDWAAYIGFALEILKLQSGAQLDPVFKQDTWRVCSALVADCYTHAGINIDPDDAVNLISPADLYDRITNKGERH